MVREAGRPQSSLNKYNSMVLRREICGILGEKELGDDENQFHLSDSLYVQASRTLYILVSIENCTGNEGLS